MEIEVAVAMPVQLCGPVRTTLPSEATVPLNPLNGAANEREQSVCVTATLWPMNEETQCAVIVQEPPALGHELAAPPSLLAAEELEPQAKKSKSSGSRASGARTIGRSYIMESLGCSC
jgi:hypothetical protein